MVTSKELLIERRVTVILDRTLFSVASSVLILQCYLCIFIWPRPVGFDDSYCTAWSRLKLSTKMVTATLYTVYQLSASMHSRGWLTLSQDKSLYSYPRVGVRGTLHPFSRAFLHRNTSTSCFILDRATVQL